MRINDNDDDDDQDDDGGGGGVPERRSVAVAGLRRYCLPYMTRAFSSSTPHTHGKIAIAEMNTLADQTKKHQRAINNCGACVCVVEFIDNNGMLL